MESLSLFFIFKKSKLNFFSMLHFMSKMVYRYHIMLLAVMCDALMTLKVATMKGERTLLVIQCVTST